MPEPTEGVLVSGGSLGTLTALATAAQARDSDRPRATAYVSEHTHAAVTKAWRILGFDPAHLRVLEADPAPPARSCRGRGRDPRRSRRGPAAVRDRRDGRHDEHGRGRPAGRTGRARAAARRVAARRRRLRRARAPHPAGQGAADRHRTRRQPRARPAQVALPALRDRRGADPRARPAAARVHARRRLPARHRRRRGRVPRARSAAHPRLTRAEALALAARLRARRVPGRDRARGIGLAEYAERRLRARGGWEVVSPASLAIVCFRRTGHDDAQTDALARAAVADGYAAPSTTIVGGRTVLRLCTINPRTTEADIEHTIERLERLDR